MIIDCVRVVARVSGDPDTGRRSGQGTLAKGSRISGAQRTTLASQYAKRYAGGESIRKIADDAGRSYGFVHNVLKESGVSLRGRGGATRGAKKTASPEYGQEGRRAAPRRRRPQQGQAPPRRRSREGAGQGDDGQEGGDDTAKATGEEGRRPPAKADGQEDPGQDDQEGGSKKR